MMCPQLKIRGRILNYAKDITTKKKKAKKNVAKIYTSNIIINLVIGKTRLQK